MKVIPIRSISANEDQSTCSSCGGECCKWMPGMYHPEDLFSGMSDLQIKQKILDMLQSNNTVVTHGELDNKRVYVLTPSAGRHRSWYNMDNFGTCANLSDSGCRLSAQDRPFECRTLVPNKDRKCKPSSDFNRDELLLEWSIYDEVIEQVFDHFYKMAA